MRQGASRAILIFALISAAAACGKSSGGGSGGGGSGGASGGGEAPRRSKDVADAAKLVELGQCETATEKLRAFVSTHPEDREAYLVLGDAWACRAFEQPKPDRLKADAALEAAGAAYESLLRLSPKDARALVSRAAVSIYTADQVAAKARLEEVLSADPKHTAAANLLAALSGSEAPLKAAYAGRARSKVPEPPQPCSPDGCLVGILVEPVEIAGKPYPAGTPLGELEIDEESGGLGFSDRLHQERTQGKGWTLTKVLFDSGGAFARLETRRVLSVPQARVLANRVPELPRAHRPGTGPDADTAANRAALATRDRWRRYAYDPDGPAKLEQELGVVAGVVQGTVKPAGEPVSAAAITNASSMYGGAREATTEFAFEFTPVAFEQLASPRRVVPAKSVAGYSVREDAAKALSASELLSPDEKRVLLRQQVAPGAPFLFAALARGYRLQDGTPSLRNGEITLVVPFAGGFDTFAGGELASTSLDKGFQPARSGGLGNLEPGPGKP